MFFYRHEDDEAEAAELRAQDRWERAQRARLSAHPHCDDPAHPGCSACSEPEDSTTTESDE